MTMEQLWNLYEQWAPGHRSTERKTVKAFLIYIETVQLKAPEPEVDAKPVPAPWQPVGSQPSITENP